MGLLYQVVLVWSLPLLLLPLSYYYFSQFSPGNLSDGQFPDVIVVTCLIFYGCLMVVRPIFPLIVITVTVLSLTGGFVYSRRSAESNNFVDDSIPAGRFWGYFCILLAGAALFRVHRLGHFGFLIDEPWHFKTAVGYLKTGTFQFWDFYESLPRKSYKRAWIYTLQVALAIKWFGRNLLVARSVSLLWGMLIFLPLLIYNRFLGLSRLQSLLSFFLVTISPYLILSSRWVRHYSMYTTLYLSVVVLLGWVITPSSTRLKGLAGTGCVIGGLLLYHLHPAPTLLLLATSLIVCSGLAVSYWSEPRNHTKRPLIPLGFTAIAIAMGVSYSFSSSTTSTKLLQLARTELNGPSLLNILYGYYTTAFPLGAGLGGLLTGAMLVTNKKIKERYSVVQLIGPLVGLLFLSRPIPLVRYSGYLIPLAIPLLVVVFSRLIGSLRIKKHWLAGVTIFILLLLPAIRFHHQLSRIWNGHQDYVSFLGDNAQHYRILGRFLRLNTSENETVVLLDVPSYHAREIESSGGETIYRSFYNERISKNKLRKLVCGTSGVWVIAAYSYRDPTPATVESYLRSHFETVSVPRLYGINVYYRPGTLACR